MRGARGTLSYVLVILGGLVLGGLLGELTQGIPAFAFLNYGQTFGLSTASPLVLDLWIVEVVLGLQFRLTVGVMVGIVFALLVFRKLR